MTLKEAEDFFKRYNGQGFHMLREEADAYKKYNQLQISGKQEDMWRLQIIEEQYCFIQSDKENAWGWFGNIIEIIHGLEETKDETLEQLMNSLKYISELDVRQRILVMEHMAGKPSGQNNGGYALYKSRNKFYKGLKENMAQVMHMTSEDFDEMNELSVSGKIGWSDAYIRYLVALNNCEHAERNFLI